jgi:hypothetical protein
MKVTRPQIVALAVGLVLVLALLVGLAWRTPTTRADVPTTVPTRIEFQSPDHDTLVSYYELDMVDPAGVVVATVAIAKAKVTPMASKPGYYEAPFPGAVPTQVGSYTARLRAVHETATDGPPPASGESPNATRVPPAASITDDEAAVWTIRTSDNVVLRNNQDAYGVGTILLYWTKEIYVWGSNNSWWHYIGTNPYWVDVGPADPAGGATPQPPTTTAQIARSPSSEPSNVWERGAVAIIY